MNPKFKNIVVCGTDTDVGKTIVSAFLVQGLQATYWKPIQSGLENGGDLGQVCRLLNLPSGRWLPESYKFQAPVSPHWAAEMENTLIDTHQLKIPQHEERIIIETAGGLMVPLTRQRLQIDQLEAWKAPVILVGRSGLGTLNHTLLSLEALRKRAIQVLGIVLNGTPHPDNPKTLEQMGNVPVIAELPMMSLLNAKTLSDQWKQQKARSNFKSFLNLLETTE